MQWLWFCFCYYLNLAQKTLQSNLNSQSMCIVHIDCAKKVALD
jgi:hypothetical protein